MFRNRKNSQKPANELYAAFKQTFPHVGPPVTPSSIPSSESAIETSTSLTSISIDTTMDQRQFGDQDTNKDQDSGFGEPDQWRFTPSILDPNSFAFASFANQQSSDFGSTPEGTNNVFHNNQAGDLHTPGMGFQLGTPLSVPNSAGQSDTTAAVDMHGFHAHLLHSQPYQNPSRFTQQLSYAPSSFIHQDSGYDTMEHPSHAMGPHRPSLDEGLLRDSAFMGFSTGRSGNAQAHPVPTMERQTFSSFRYRVTLNAPTAMIKDSDEIPVTYLNKGQAYAVSISDSMGFGPATGPIKYRTVIRISFEDEQQRQRPSACWQLWKEGRGLAESHLRGGKLQAVEYVDPNQGGDEETKRPRVELEAASFDSFSVTWTPSAGSRSADCSVAVRFNFLSTDFSHSKGVKGIPVRLCAKTEIISSGTPDSPPAPTAEVCFCKVKLFRDHGAERKLSNDIAHIKKTIDKLNQQITQVENGVKDVGKRKRSGADKGGSHRPGKIQKHKRTWSISSQGSNGRPPVEEDLHMKLATMQDMFTSTRPVSVLYLKGYEQDDPDLFPVALPGEPLDLTKASHSDRRTSWDCKAPTESTPTTSYIASPSPSSRSVPSDSRPCEPASFPKPVPYISNQQLSNEWEGPIARPQFTNTNLSDYASPSTATKVPKGHTDETMSNWINAFEVDPSYKAPSEKPIKPIACFYVLIKVPGDNPGEDYYRAVYLMERTVKELINSIAMKCGVDPSDVTRTLRLNPRGLKIMVDDEVVRELPEGQDMIVEFAQMNASPGFKQEAGSGASTPKATQTPTKSTSNGALEMRLSF